MNRTEQFRRLRAMLKEYPRGLALLDQHMDGAQMDGGPGSGNWGHEGRQGLRGGSAPGGGQQNRHWIPELGRYSSFSKHRAVAAAPHKVTKEELNQIPDKSVFVTAKGSFVYEKKGILSKFKPTDGESGTLSMEELLEMKDVRISIPDSANRNLQRDQVNFLDLMDRMEKAPRYESRESVDRDLRPGTEELWKNLDRETKQHLAEYTSSLHESINKQMRTGEDLGRDRCIKNIQSAMEKTRTAEDRWYQRGISFRSAGRMLGVSALDLKKVVRGEVPKETLLGLQGKDNGFMSCGSTEGTGFDMLDVQMHIFAPKGTKAIYAEPFSYSGSGFGEAWNGKKQGGLLGGEFETIFGKGTSVRVARVWVDGGTLHLDTCITGQD